MIKRITLVALALCSLAIAGDIGTKVKTNTPTICCVVPCTPPMICRAH